MLCGTPSLSLPSMKHLQSIPGFETLQLTIDRMILNLPGAYPDAHTKEQQVLDLLLDCNLLSDPDDVFVRRSTVGVLSPWPPW
mgnify:CR=1 FL=1